MVFITHRQGFRFRIHEKHLPGTSGLTLKKYKAVIFIHGCYWHRHEGCRLASLPKQNIEFWRKKFNVTVCRDGVVYIKTLASWLKSECEYIDISEEYRETDRF